MKVAVIVRENMVRAVYASERGVDVEVLDLDEPIHLTAKERADFERKEAIAEEIRKSPRWHLAW